jgi:hypothetical protein
LVGGTILLVAYLFSSTKKTTYGQKVKKKKRGKSNLSKFFRRFFKKILYNTSNQKYVNKNRIIPNDKDNQKELKKIKIEI